MKIDGNNSTFIPQAPADLAADASRRTTASPVVATGQPADAPSAIVHQTSESQAALQLYDRLAQMPKTAPAKTDDPVVTPEGAAELLKRALSAMGGMQAEGKLDTLVSKQWLQALAGN